MIKLFLLLISLTLLGHSSRADLLLIVPEKNPPLLSLASQLAQASQQQVDIHLLSANAVDESKYQAVILAGPDSLESWQGSLPAVSVFASRALVSLHRKKIQSAIYYEPSLLQQAALARVILSGQQSIGVLANQPLAAYGLDQQSAERLEVKQYGVEDSFSRQFNLLLRNEAALIGVADSDLYNSENIKTILISAYRLNRPLIGPTFAYLRAGALASVFSNIEDTSRRLSEILTAGQQGKWPAPNYNPYFHVGVNKQVGRSLNIALPNEDKLVQQVEALLADLPPAP
ncbi:MAG: hypothetical protein WAO12_00205 [Venatoribacter sp.]